MTMQEVIENELKCVQRDCCRLENECAKCDLVLPQEEIINAYNKALRLEKENAELRNNGFTVSAMTEQQLKVALEKGEQLEKENAELKERLKEHESIGNVQFWENVWLWRMKAIQLTEAKDLIRNLLRVTYGEGWNYSLDVKVKAEDFLKENK